MTAVLTFLNLIPRWVLASIIAGLAFTSGRLLWENKGLVVDLAKANATIALANAAIQKQKAEAGATLLAETNKTRAVEQALQVLKDKLELQDADHQKTIADLSARIRVAAGAAMRLRDPNAATGCRLGSGSPQSQPTSPTDTGPADTAETDGLFSEPATQLLERLTREADDINAAYQSCRDYAAKVTEQTP